jgi:hypothetical protein
MKHKNANAIIELNGLKSRRMNCIGSKYNYELIWYRIVIMNRYGTNL